MANIQVGGKIARNGRARIERPFAGVIAGLSVNRLRVLDLAAERDPHINVRGDVQLVTGVLDRNDQRMQQVRILNKKQFVKLNFNLNQTRPPKQSLVYFYIITRVVCLFYLKIFLLIGCLFSFVSALCIGRSKFFNV